MAFVKSMVNKYVTYRKRPDDQHKRNISTIRDEVSMLFSQEQTLSENISSSVASLHKLKANKKKLYQYSKVYSDHLQKLATEKKQEPLIAIEEISSPASLSASSSSLSSSQNLSSEEIGQLQKTLEELKPQIETLDKTIQNLEAKIYSLMEKKNLLREKRLQVEKDLLECDPNYVALQDIEIHNIPDTEQDESVDNTDTERLV